MTDQQHSDLADALHECVGTVMLSGYPSPLYDELYDGWERLDRQNLANTANRNGARKVTTEVVWSNKPLRAQMGLSL